MKTLFITALLALSFGLNAQMPKIQKAVIKTPAAKCQECKDLIERFAPQYLDGLVKINVNFRNGTTQVSWYPDRTNIEEIKTAIANSGFDADDVTANPDIYKKVPPCCKKPEETAAPPKN